MWITPNNYKQLLDNIVLNPEKYIPIFINQPNVIKQDIIDKNITFDYLLIFKHYKLNVNLLSIIWILFKKNYSNVNIIYRNILNSISIKWFKKSNNIILNVKFVDLTQAYIISKYYIQEFENIKWILDINKKNIELCIYKKSKGFYNFKDFLKRYATMTQNFFIYLLNEENDQLIDYLLVNDHIKINKKNIIEIIGKKKLCLQLYKKNKYISEYINLNIFKLSKLLIKNDMMNIIPKTIFCSPEYILSLLSLNKIEEKYSEKYLLIKSLPWKKPLQFLLEKTDKDKIVDLIILLDKKYGSHHINNFFNRSNNIFSSLNYKNWEKIVTYLKFKRRKILVDIFTILYLKNTSLKVLKLFIDNIINIPALFILEIIKNYIKIELYKTKRLYLVTKYRFIKTVDYIIQKKCLMNPSTEEKKIIGKKMFEYNNNKYYELKGVLWKIIEQIGFLDFFSNHIYFKTCKIDSECPICYENIKKDTGCKLVCNHSFHKECLDKSFSMKSYFQIQPLEYCLNCPYCRKIVLKY